MNRQAKGDLLKMRSEVNDEQVNYFLNLKDNSILINDLIGKEIILKHTGVIHCIKCGKVTKKSFAQGFCYNCMQTAPETEECVLRPNLCKAHLGVARDMEYAKEHCLRPHFVYLSNTGDVKVGVTRQSQIPTRWIDQGATSAVKICKTPNRHMAGLIEIHLGQHFTDKTHWRRMVSDQVDSSINMTEHREKAISLLNPEMLPFVCEDDKVYQFNYPVQKYPLIPKSLNFDSQPEIKGILTGIKGQYIMLNNEMVFNIRRHNGYEVELMWDELT